MKKYAFFAPLLCLHLAAFAAPPPETATTGDTLPQQILEMKKTKHTIRFDVTFSDCDAPHTFKVQDGAMNRLSTAGRETVQFIMKQHGKDDVRFHLINPKTYTHNDRTVQGLAVDGGTRLTAPQAGQALPTSGLVATLPEPLARLGITSLTLHRPDGKAGQISTQGLFGEECDIDYGCGTTDNPFPGGWDGGGTGGAPTPTPTPTPAPQWRCCNFTGCDGKTWRFCTSGDTGGCGGDDCGSCCV